MVAYYVGLKVYRTNYLPSLLADGSETGDP